jgi:hypothetical protein
MNAIDGTNLNAFLVLGATFDNDVGHDFCTPGSKILVRDAEQQGRPARLLCYPVPTTRAFSLGNFVAKAIRRIC